MSGDDAVALGVTIALAACGAVFLYGRDWLRKHRQELSRLGDAHVGWSEILCWLVLWLCCVAALKVLVDAFCFSVVPRWARD
jgi:ABC-type Fe3+ transport system permease subunit